MKNKQKKKQNRKQKRNEIIFNIISYIFIETFFTYVLIDILNKL